VDNPWRFVLELARPHKRRLLGYGALLAIATSLPLAASVVLGRFVDLIVQRAPAGRLVPLALGYAAIGLIASVVTVFTSWRSTTLAWLVTDRLRHELAGHVLAADLSFHRDRTPGELVTRVDADVTAMTKFLSQVMANVIAIVALGIAAVLVLAIIRPPLAPLMAVGVALIGITAWKQRNTATAVTVAERTAEADSMSIAEQYLAGAEDVSALGGGRHGVARSAQAEATLVHAGGRRVWVQMRVQGSVRAVIAVAEVMMIAGGALAARRGWVTIGDVFLGYRFVAVVRQPVQNLSWRLHEAQGASGAARRVLDLLAERGEVVSGSEPLPDGPLDLQFEGVELIYDDGDGEAAAIQRLDLTVPAGRVIGLVGRSGSGKTSLARLVLRLVAPTTGRILVGGVDLATVDEQMLRRRVSAIPQDVQLFPGTVHDNVTLFARVPEADVIDALTAAGLGPWLANLPNGLATKISSDGRTDDDDAEHVGLSAGESQLLSLARAQLRRPNILVLDEATSRVDPDTQAALAAATARLVFGRTALVIAHRLDTLTICDHIAVMDGGRLVEYGERLALAADATSRYARLLAASELEHTVDLDEIESSLT
jgi:ATP-binding cassette, subfamily B, bacterial